MEVMLRHYGSGGGGLTVSGPEWRHETATKNPVLAVTIEVVNGNSKAAVVVNAEKLRNALDAARLLA